MPLELTPKGKESSRKLIRRFSRAIRQTGILKRALKANKFEVELRNGFGGKRHSTRAIRSSLS